MVCQGETWDLTVWISVYGYQSGKQRVSLWTCSLNKVLMKPDKGVKNAGLGK